MPRRDRVGPDAGLLAVPDRGLYWGNRGSIHDESGEIVRHHRGRAWIVCLLDFKGRRRELWAPGRLTELFFLDEATGLAAGHRPCGECRSADHRAFKEAWRVAHPGEPSKAADIDARLHADRLVGTRSTVKRTHRASLADLPDGTMIDLDGGPWLVWAGALHAWSPGGYGERRDRSGVGDVVVLTPRATVMTLRAGYEPVVHPTAAVARGPHPRRACS